jgi:hypothetical protein
MMKSATTFFPDGSEEATAAMDRLWETYALGFDGDGVFVLGHLGERRCMGTPFWAEVGQKLHNRLLRATAWYGLDGLMANNPDLSDALAAATEPVGLRGVRVTSRRVSGQGSSDPATSPMDTAELALPDGRAVEINLDVLLYFRERYGHLVFWGSAPDAAVTIHHAGELVGFVMPIVRDGGGFYADL